jgi:hypothetical protein
MRNRFSSETEKIIPLSPVGVDLRGIVGDIFSV